MRSPPAGPGGRMLIMSDAVAQSSPVSSAAARPVRDAADAYVQALAELDPSVATELGLPAGQDRLPDLSPAGQQALDDLARSTLSRLDELERAAGQAGGYADADERRCARLLRERLTSGLAVSAAGEPLRNVSNIFGPPEGLRETFLLMPATTPEDWAVIARRMAVMPEALAGYRESLAEGARRGLYAAPRQVQTVAGQLAEWQASGDGRGWFADFASAADVPDSLRDDLGKGAASADAAAAGLRDWLLADYLPGTHGTPDGVGEERYRITARGWIGADLNLTEAYEWGWGEYQRIWAEMGAEAGRILPEANPKQAMDHLEEHGQIVTGVPEIQRWLQEVMDGAMSDLDGTHFDLADPIKVCETRIAPAGSAAAPYYTGPSLDFSRPGRTWLPTLGKTSFPVWALVSTWYHEGVPGHHLQIAQWTYLASRLSTYQTTVGGVSANLEGWALYAERLMDELGFLTDPGVRMGYLEAQIARAIRVVIDIGMHLSLTVPADSPMYAGEQWTAERALEFFLAHSGQPRDYLDSEIVRYLGGPGQAIGYKLGERAWLEGREAARAAHGPAFDLKAWHMAALSQGSLGLDDLASELSRL
jgi:uncharacterized protein (DUF885 family)